jgi:hypothetical protein
MGLLIAALLISAGCLNGGNSSSPTISPSTQQSIKSLIKDLKNTSDLDVRWNAAQELGNIGDGSAVIPLIETLKNDTDYRIRFLAAKSLGEIKDERAVEPLIEALKNDSDSAVKAHAATALGDIGDKRAIAPLIDTFSSDFVFGVYPDAAQNALAKIGEPAVDPLIEALKGPSKERAIIALGMIGDKRATEPLIEIMNNPSRDVFGDKEKLITIPIALGKIKDKRAVQPLVKQIPLLKLSDDLTLFELSYRGEVVNALGAIGPDAKDAVPALLEMVQNPVEKLIATSGSVPVGGLHSNSNSITVQMYEGKMHIRLGSIIEAIDALGNIGDNRAVPVLETLANSSDEEIQYHAKESLMKIKYAIPQSSTEPMPSTTSTGSEKLVRLETNMGTITIALDPNMPVTAGNFESLVKKGFYDGVIFHRVIDGFML